MRCASASSSARSIARSVSGEEVDSIPLLLNRRGNRRRGVSPNLYFSKSAKHRMVHRFGLGSVRSRSLRDAVFEAVECLENTELDAEAGRAGNTSIDVVGLETSGDLVDRKLQVVPILAP